MDYQYVKAFLAVGRHLNFTKAGNELLITQAAISRQIKLFEESIGEQLLIRSPQQVLLTERGKELFEILNSNHQKFETEFLKKKNTQLRVGIIEGVLINWFIEKINQFKSLKNYQLEIQVDRTQKLIDQLMESKIDLFIGTTKIQTGVLTSRLLFKEEFVLISNEKINLQKLENYPWIIYSDSDPLMQLPKRSSQIIKVNSIFSMRKLVESSLGIAILPAHCIPENSGLHKAPWKKSKGEIYLTTQNFQLIPQWYQELGEVLFNN